MKPEQFTDVAVLITAAGNSSRMGSGRKKEFEALGGRTVLTETLKCFFDAGFFSRFIITMTPESMGRARQLVDDFVSSHLSLPGICGHRRDGPERIQGDGTGEILIEIIEGGASRQESVCRGLEALARSSPSYVLIHDGARPWVSIGTIRRVIHGTRAHGACIPVLATVDALKTVDPEGFITGHPSRHDFFRAQTPQGFAFPDILKAHHQAAQRAGSNVTGGYVDDSHLFCEYGGRVYTVPGNFENIKITYASDIAGARQHEDGREEPVSR